MIDKAILEMIALAEYRVVRVARCEPNGTYWNGSGPQKATSNGTTIPVIIVEKIPVVKYRDVKAPDDLGQVCEFSDFCNFPPKSTVEGRLYSVGLQKYGPGLAFRRISEDKVFLNCRTRDEP